MKTKYFKKIKLALAMLLVFFAGMFTVTLFRDVVTIGGYNTAALHTPGFTFEAFCLINNLIRDFIWEKSGSHAFKWDIECLVYPRYGSAYGVMIIEKNIFFKLNESDLEELRSFIDSSLEHLSQSNNPWDIFLNDVLGRNAQRLNKDGID